MEQALQKDSESEYTLSTPYNSVWITVDTLSVYIKRNDDNVSVSIYRRGFEDGESAITETWAGYDDEIEEDIEGGDS